MIKLDLKKEYKTLFTAKHNVIEEINAPAVQHLMIDGQGDPNVSREYHAAIETLFGVSYTLKFACKRGGPGVDYVVAPLEGLWWHDDMALFSVDRKDEWKWTAMILQPAFITPEMVDAALREYIKKKKLPAAPPIRLEMLAEGLCVQALHVGPYSEEAPLIARMHTMVKELGAAPRGKHHEIYLSDARKTPPEKLKTIIRQPIQR